MNSVHLNVLSNSINCMFRSCVEMELNTIISGSCFMSIRGMLRVKSLNWLSWFINSNLRSMSIPSDSNFDFLISVNFVEIVKVRGFQWPSTSFKINWTLVFTFCAQVTINYDISPVSSIFLVIPFSSFYGCDWSENEECFQKAFHQLNLFEY